MPLPWLRKPQNRHRKHTCCNPSFSSHTISPWRGFVLYAELDLWARAQWGGGSLCPISAAHVTAPGQLSKVPAAPSHGQQVSPLRKDQGMDTQSCYVAFGQHTAPCPTAELVMLCQPPQLHSHGTFTHTECAEQSSTVPSPSTNQSPHSNLFLLQFKVLWHFIWKIL